MVKCQSPLDRRDYDGGFGELTRARIAVGQSHMPVSQYELLAGRVPMNEERTLLDRSELHTDTGVGL